MHQPYGDAQRTRRGRLGQRVLPQLATIREVGGDRHVLAGAEVRGRSAVRRGQDERDRVLGLVATLGHGEGTPRRRVVDPGRGVETRLLADQAGREQPVDLVPGGSHLRRHRVAQDLGDGAHQVLADDRVLLGTDAERGVPMRDPGGDRVERGRLADQVGAERRDRPGQGPALLAGRLRAAAEQVEQVRVLAEHGLVEPARDGVQMLTHRGERGPDDGTAGFGKHEISLFNALTVLALCAGTAERQQDLAARLAGEVADGDLVEARVEGLLRLPQGTP